MAKLPRVTNRRFGADIDVNDIGQFGSVAAGEKTNTKDVSKIQELAAWLKGWSKATMSANKYPTMQERNGVDYVHAYQIDYMLKEGVPEYDSKTEYNVNSIVKGVVNNEMKLFSSLLDESVGQDLTNESAWKELSFGGGGLEIGDIGIAALGIDETKGKRRYLNGQLIIQEQYVQFTNKVKSAVALYPSLACTESEWQTTATMTVGGQVGKFVVDNDAGTIRLPKIIMPIQGLTDLSKLGEIVEAGLPNIAGTWQNYQNGYGAGSDAQCSYSGAFYNAGSNGSKASSGDNASRGYVIGLDASRSNDIYGNSDTVQQEQIQYPYFIQVATGAETEDNIINDIELNNPYSLGDSKYSPVALNNLSWLKSEGQYNSKAIYPAYYDWLLKIYNGVEVVDGVSVKLSTEEYTDYDFVLNTAEETFRLPLLDGSEDLVSDRYESLTLLESGSTYTALANGWFWVQKTTSGTNHYIGFTNLNNGVHVQDAKNHNGADLTLLLFVLKGETIRVDYTAGGATGGFKFIYAQGNGSLYFYVGETVQNANLINAGRIEEKLVNKVDYANTQWAVNCCMPDYENGITSDNVAMGTWVQVTKDSFVITYAGDPFLEGYFIYVSPDKTTKYTVGHRMDDVNSSTQATTFAFFVPKGWYFQNNAEGPSSYHIYPLKGAN